MGEIDKKDPMFFQRPSQFSCILSILDMRFPRNPCGEVAERSMHFGGRHGFKP